MARKPKQPTPDDRPDRWKARWGGLRQVPDEETTAAFEAFCEAFVPSHIRGRFIKTFGVPKAGFGNRYFHDDASFKVLPTRMTDFFAPEATHVEAIVFYALDDEVEAHRMRGETRRTFQDLFVDDWHAACAMVTGGGTTLYAFIEPKMKGSVVRVVTAEEG